MKNPKTGAVLRMLVAAYLIYLGVSIVRNTEEGVPKPLIVVFATLFIVCGAGYIIYSYRMMKRAEEQQATDIKSEEDGESTEYLPGHDEDGEFGIEDKEKSAEYLSTSAEDNNDNIEEES